MLISAFTGDSDHVFIDLLTSTDLEMLKMKKKAAASGSADTSMDSTKTGNRAASMRRYCILTYASEFDRVHYPLPLSYETTPNVESLLSTIRRLRKEAQERKMAAVSDKEK
jgi:coiled-coil domain-containing protein 61